MTTSVNGKWQEYERILNHGKDTLMFRLYFCWDKVDVCTWCYGYALNVMWYIYSHRYWKEIPDKNSSATDVILFFHHEGKCLGKSTFSVAIAKRSVCGSCAVGASTLPMLCTLTHITSMWKKTWFNSCLSLSCGNFRTLRIYPKLSHGGKTKWWCTRSPVFNIYGLMPDIIQKYNEIVTDLE